jgi:DNA-binding NarL/FixJ family response regulator
MTLRSAFVRRAAYAVRRGNTSRASACVRTVSGHWLRAEGTELPVGEADVAVILQPATAHDLIGTLAAHHQLTARESEILGLITHGLAGKHIASELGIRCSP